MIVCMLHHPAAADGVVHPHHRVADLVQPPGDRRVGAVGDVLTVDVQRAAPLAVVVAVEAEVQPAAEMDAGVAQRLNGDRPVAAVGHREVHRAAEHAPVGRSKRRSGRSRGEALDACRRVLDAAFDQRSS